MFSWPPERDKVMYDGPPEAKSSPPELYKLMKYPLTGPPEKNLSPPDQNKVTKYSWMLEMYSGPPERDKVTSSGPPEENLSPLVKIS